MNDQTPLSSSRRQEILDAAAAVFAQKGYHGTGMRDIAERLGMKAGSLYFHLASKDAALEEVCAAGLQSALRAAEHAVGVGGDLNRRIRALVESQVRDLKVHGDYISVFVHERRQLTAQGQKRLSEVTRKHGALLDRIFEDARAKGELADGIEPRAARYAMVGLLRNFTQLYVEGPIRDFDAVAAQVTEIFLSGASSVRG